MSTSLTVKSVTNDHVCSWREWAVVLLSFVKIKISLLVTLTAGEAYILAAGQTSIHMLLPLTAVFFLACGASGLNQYQERRTDGLMERTRGRPVPSGKLNPCTALRISLGLIFWGLSILFFATGEGATILGIFAVLWYNGVYTFLKRRTAFAGIPGALAGSIPPVLGWVSGGGSILDPGIGAIAFFFFLWQIPHGWLLQIVFERDYKSAGLPCLPEIFRAEQLRGILYVWIMSASTSCLLIPLFVSVHFHAVQVLLLAGTFWLMLYATRVLKFRSNRMCLETTFTRLNAYAFAVLLLLSLDRVLSSGAISLQVMNVRF